MLYPESDNYQNSEYLVCEPTSSFKELKIWQKAHAIVLQIYQLTKQLPEEEKFGLISQIRRAGVSVAANIAEGYKRRGLADKIRILNYSQSSLEEVKYYLLLIKDLFHIETDNEYNDCEELGKIMNGYISSIEGKRKYKDKSETE